MITLFITLFLSTSAAQAAEDGWGTFEKTCSSELQLHWPAEAEKGRTWTRTSVKNLEGLKEMTTKICPAYLAHRNDGAAIQQFVAKKREIVDQSPVVEKDGNALVSFLQTQLARHQAEFAPDEIDFSKSRCGRLMRDTTDRMKARLTTIKNTANALAANCININDKADAALQVKALKAADARALSAVPTAYGAQKTKASSISGVELDKAKRK